MERPNGSGLSYTRLSAYLDRNADGDFADAGELLAVKGTADAPPSLPGITAVSSLLANAKPRITVKDGRIRLTPAVLFSLYSSNGRQLSPDALLPAGVYLVKTVQGVVKVVVS